MRSLSNIAMRGCALVSLAALAACSGGGTPSAPIANPVPVSSPPAPAGATRTSFTIHWPAAKQRTGRTSKAISASTASITVAVNGAAPTVVNKPTLSGSPSSTTISIDAPVGIDSFTITAWDQPGGAGNKLDSATVSQEIIANANNTVTATLDGICASLQTYVYTASSYIQTRTASVPLASGTVRSVLQSVRLVGPAAATFAVNQLDADGNVVVNSAGSVPIELSESGSTPHVTIAPVSTNAGNNEFTLTPLVGEPDGFSTTITAASPNCGTGTTTFPNSFALSTSAEIVVADEKAGVIAFDQDGTQLAKLSTTAGIVGLAYNSKSPSFVSVETTSATTGGITFQTFSTTGTSLGSGKITLSSSFENPIGNIAYNPVNGYYLVDLREYTDSSSTTHYGAVKEYTISASTATAITPTGTSPFNQGPPPPYDPDCFAILQNGDVIVGDDMTDSYLYDQNGNYLGNSAYEATTLTLDPVRNNVIDSYNSTYAYVLPESTLSNIGTFYYPGYSTLLSTGPTASVYSPGNDTVYFFAPNYAAGVQDYTAEFSASNVPSTLPLTAFAGLTEPTEAVALP
jgi:hypothetical protein